MNEYAVWFEYDKRLYRLPVNPETIETSSTMNIDKYNILKTGQIAIPANMELKEYSFETEFPSEYRNSLSVTDDTFKSSGFYLSLFEQWRKTLSHVKFIAAAYEDNGIDLEKSINSEVLIEEMTTTEKYGEEGDKYISFRLLEYYDYSAKKATELITSMSISGETVLKKKALEKETVNKKNNGNYVVKSGDSLWSIAKKYYSDGSKYTKIYNANKDKIKNPALIYPGTKLVVPA